MLLTESRCFFANLNFWCLLVYWSPLFIYILILNIVFTIEKSTQRLYNNLWSDIAKIKVTFNNIKNDLKLENQRKLTLQAPTPQNVQTHSNKCVWPFCGVGAKRVKYILSKLVWQEVLTDKFVNILCLQKGKTRLLPN